VISAIWAIRKAYWRSKVRLTAKSVPESFYIGGPSSVNSETIFGSHSSSNGITVKGCGRVSIGDFVHTGCDLLILTSNHKYLEATKLPYDERNVDKDVTIGRCVWIGDRVTILGGVNIGEGAIIQAGSVVINDIPDLGIAGGNPAKVFKSRDPNHYYTLVSQSSFLLLD
jgi:chloramphenicol O-acetyltransferase type B